MRGPLDEELLAVDHQGRGPKRREAGRGPWQPGPPEEAPVGLPKGILPKKILPRGGPSPQLLRSQRLCWGLLPERYHGYHGNLGVGRVGARARPRDRAGPVSVQKSRREGLCVSPSVTGSPSLTGAFLSQPEQEVLRSGRRPLPKRHARSAPGRADSGRLLPRPPLSSCSTPQSAPGADGGRA
jgi:hypothetical protein